MSNTYQDFLGQRELGDRAMKQRDYRKAVQRYEQAISGYNSPGPKYDAVVWALAEAKTHLAKSSATGKKGPALVEDGVFKPSSVWVRLFTNEQMQESE
ncbi:MAG: hypothetical protein NTX88_11555 [Candidatus Atribacteria bacterium]|nr:hypothetical protein [Candidatus Atribacteria bacterium]